MRLTRDPIDVGRLLQSVGGADRGGNCVFVGSVRRGPDDGPVEAIEYSAYEEMAEEEFAQILAEARERWPSACVAVQHRLGRIPTGEASVVVACAAPHRADAFAASRFVIEQTKQRVPIWKREIYEGGGTRWRTNTKSEDVA